MAHVSKRAPKKAQKVERKSTCSYVLEKDVLTIKVKLLPYDKAPVSSSGRTRLMATFFINDVIFDDEQVKVTGNVLCPNYEE